MRISGPARAAVWFLPIRSGGVVAVPGGGQLGLVDVVQGAVDRERGVCQAFHGPQRVRGLGGPAPPARRGGVGDGLQFAQGMRIAQSVPATLAVAVIRRPGVVHGDPGEGRQHPGGVHRLPSPPGVDGDQGELPRRRRVDPGQLPGDPEPGLIEVRHVSGGQAPRGSPPGCRRATRRPGVTMPATAPGETGTPNSSLIASQVRSRDRNCPAPTNRGLRNNPPGIRR